MNNFHEKYKRKPGGMPDPSTGRIMRAGLHEERRKVNRAAHFSRYRDVSASPKQASEVPATSNLSSRLRKWKMEKELRKKLELRKKKPVFKVGVVHHHFYSPTAKDAINSKFTPCHTRGARKAKTQASPPKRITRATQKRLEAKKVAAASASDSARGVSQSDRKKKAIPSAEPPSDVSFAPRNYAFKGPAAVKTMPMFGRFALNGDTPTNSEHLKELKASMDKPWPGPSNIAAAAKSPLRIRKRSLMRQGAVDRSRLSEVCENSSPIEDSSAMENSKKTSESSSVRATVETLSPESPSPAMFSPYVTTSRGKDGARRERRSKMGIARTPPDDVPTKDTVMMSLNISVEEEERTAQYFKFILQREIERLNETCAKWETIKSEPGLTEDARYLINQAIGQTTLLMRKKFERFRGLVADCETGKGEMLVQCRDLQGFWDMTCVEVKNCDARFQRLEELRSNDWIEEEIVVTTSRPAGIRKKTVANKFATNAKSSARSWIMARRKEMSQTEGNNEAVVLVRHDSEESRPTTSGSTDGSPREKTRRSARSSPRSVPRSAKRASRKITPINTPSSLLRKVQLSETRKNVLSPLAVMKISKMCKTPEIRLDDTISYVNSDQIPGRGILKRSDDASTMEISVAKSSRKVDFNDDVSSVETPIDENLENSIDLGRALARIDSYDSDNSDDVSKREDVASRNVTLRRVEKRLDFENEDEDTDNADSTAFVAATPEIFALPPVTLPRSAESASTNELGTSTTRKSTGSSRITELENEIRNAEEEASTTRVLRTRIVSTITPQKSTRRSIKSSSARKTFVDLNSSTKENDDPDMRARKTHLSEASNVAELKCDSEEPTKIRRSTRKSVRFNAEDCTACADLIKPVHPMTPHSRRSRKVSLLGDNARESVGPLFDGDLISFDSPAKIAVPSRVRRTSTAPKKSSSQ